jgi:hypothetical protein
MNNLVVLHTGHALDLLRVLLGLLGLLGLLRFLGDQLLWVLDHILQLRGPSSTRLELLISLMLLGLEVVNIALGGGQLVLSVLQPGAGIVKEVGLDVTAVISPH